jgi:xanthine/uracil permease
MNLRASIFGPAATKAQAIFGAVVASALSLLVGFGLKQDAGSAVFTALLVGSAVLMIGLKRISTAPR